MAACAAAALTGAPMAHAGEAAPGLRAFKDPVTGKLRAPTAAEAKALEQAAKPRAGAPLGLVSRKPNPQPIQHPDGSTQVELDDSTVSYSVATRSADGSIQQQCVTGAQAAADIVKGGKVAAAISRAKKEDAHGLN